MSIETAIDEYLHDQPKYVRDDAVIRAYAYQHLGTTGHPEARVPSNIAQLNASVMQLPDLDRPDDGCPFYARPGVEMMQELWAVLIEVRAAELRK